LLPRDCGPRSWRGVAAPDEIVDLLSRFRPIDPRLRLPDPAFIARLRFILNGFRCAPGDGKVCALQKGFDPERKYFLEIDGPERVVRLDADLFLQNDGPFVEAVGWPKNREPGLRPPQHDRPADRGRPAMKRQKRGMKLNHAVARDRDEG